MFSDKECNYSDFDKTEDYCVPFEQEIRPDSLGQAYVPWQYFCSLFDAEESLMHGTIFTELFKPYHKKKCKSHK